MDPDRAQVAPASLCGYETFIRPIPLRGRTWRILGPREFESLLDDPRVQARFSRDEYMPYWAEFWPAALLLADHVATWPSCPAAAPVRVLEVGCGLGLIGLVAHALGYDVTISDYDEDALAFVRASAALNGLSPPRTAYVDWRETYPELRVQRILAGEVLYETRNLTPIAAFLRQHLLPGGHALLCDRNRSVADGFAAAAEREGLRVGQTPARLAAETGPVIEGRIFRVEVAG